MTRSFHNPNPSGNQNPYPSPPTWQPSIADPLLSQPPHPNPKPHTPHTLDGARRNSIPRPSKSPKPKNPCPHPQLLQMEQGDGILSATLTIANTTAVSLPVRQAAAIQLKNFVSKRWPGADLVRGRRRWSGGAGAERGSVVRFDTHYHLVAQARAYIQRGLTQLCFALCGTDVRPFTGPHAAILS